jgi:hypothetical protein
MVVEAAHDWSEYWEDIPGLTLSARARMLDHQLIAECAGVLLQGVVDGGQAKINKLYKQYDDNFDQKELIYRRLGNVRDFIVDDLSDGLNSAFSRPAHFLMLFAAAAHALYGIPQGALTAAEFPDGPVGKKKISETANDDLLFLSSIIDGEIEANRFLTFAEASSASTQRIASRRIRFPVVYSALVGTLAR